MESRLAIYAVIVTEINRKKACQYGDLTLFEDSYISTFWPYYPGWCGGDIYH